jgi:hypothetical protein
MSNHLGVGKISRRSASKSGRLGRRSIATSLMTYARWRDTHGIDWKLSGTAATAAFLKRVKLRVISSP